MRGRIAGLTAGAALSALMALSLAAPPRRAQPPSARPFRPPAGLKVFQDVPYGTEERQVMDIYLPSSPGPHPAVVLIHGGAWVTGDKSRMGPFAIMLARRGYVAASVNYRLAPQHHWPAQLDDVQRAVRWLRHNAKKFGINPKKMASWGASAGGHLAAFLGVRKAHDNSDPVLSKYSARVQCVVDLFGPTDLVAASTTSGASVVELLIGKPYSQAPDLWKDASPLYFVTKDDAPFYIVHGTADTVVPIWQSEKMEKALRKAGVEVHFVKVKGMGHGLRAANPAVRAAIKKALDGAMEFLDEHLKH